MSGLTVVRFANAKFSPKFSPVAVFLGGTSGIGQSMADGFAHYTNGNARILIIGRNRAAAESIIGEFPRPTIPAMTETGPLHEFVNCDALLMKNCQATTSDLLARLPKINYLVLSPGFLTLEGRTETSEGIDRKLSLNYYARWKFIKDLLPLLKKAADNGEDAKVMSVLAAGHGGEIDLNDLGLYKTYSTYNAAMAVPTYTDLMLEEFSAREPEIAFTQIYPGLVRTPLLNIFTHWALKPLNTLMYILLYPFATSPDDCSEYMLHALFNGDKGVFRRGERGQDLKKTKYYPTRNADEARKKLWDHTEQVIAAALAS